MVLRLFINLVVSIVSICYAYIYIGNGFVFYGSII